MGCGCGKGKAKRQKLEIQLPGGTRIEKSSEAAAKAFVAAHPGARILTSTAA